MTDTSLPTTSITLVTIDGFFGQSIPTEKSLDIIALKEGLESNGFLVCILDIEELANSRNWNKTTDTVFLLGSHQNPEIKQYLNDVVSVAALNCNARFLPRPELLIAHENKGVQSLLGRMLDLKLPEQEYRLTTKSLETPTVIKHITGAGSQMVFVADKNQSYKSKLLKTGLSLLTVRDMMFYLKTPIKRLMRWKHFTKDYIKYNARYFRHVTQTLLPSPGFDFKVLVFYDRVYVLQRGQRAGDFRASGSGQFTFTKPNIDLIEFAIAFRQKLNTPYASLDLIQKNDSIDCIEFQCVHFGPYTQMHANHYYTIQNSRLIEEPNTHSTEECYIYAISSFLRNFTPKTTKEC